MLFNFRKRERHSDIKEQLISTKQDQLTHKIDEDINAYKQLNKVLSNGITIEIKKAIGGKHG